GQGLDLAHLAAQDALAQAVGAGLDRERAVVEGQLGAALLDQVSHLVVGRVAGVPRPAGRGRGPGRRAGGAPGPPGGAGGSGGAARWRAGSSAGWRWASAGGHEPAARAASSAALVSLRGERIVRGGRVTGAGGLALPARYPSAQQPRSVAPARGR